MEAVYCYLHLSFSLYLFGVQLSYRKPSFGISDRMLLSTLITKHCIFLPIWASGFCKLAFFSCYPALEPSLHCNRRLAVPLTTKSMVVSLTYSTCVLLTVLTYNDFFNFKTHVPAPCKYWILPFLDLFMIIVQCLNKLLYANWLLGQKKLYTNNG